MFQPVVKWSGSKRSQAERIVSYFPVEIGTYYEPFCGGCSVMRQLAETETIHVERYSCSDLNSHLIDLWVDIKNHPDSLYKEYTEFWKELNKDEDIERRKEYFNIVRENFNKASCKESGTFLFLLRTCMNGMPRYNSKGEFNTSLHFTRPGIQPEKLKDILGEWSGLLNEKNVEFNCCSYGEIKPGKDDFLYLDPPYFNTKGMYSGGLDFEKFFEWLGNLSCKWVLSFDGKVEGKKDYTVELPKALYNRHIYIESGNSSFRRLKLKDKNNKVFESLYLNF